MNKLFKVLLLLGICLGLGVSCAAANPTVYLKTQSFDLLPGSTQSVEIVMSEIPSIGFSGYNISISIQDPNVAEITAVTFPSWATLSSNSSFPSSSVWIQALDLTNQVKDGATNVSLGTITFKGKGTDSSNIILSSKDVEDENGDLITVDFIPGIINPKTPVPPVITWSNPADIIYGTPLGTTQLNAVAKDATGTTVSGQYVYTPEAGAILGAGTQKLHVEFKPTDTASYITVSKDVTINVKKATPTITWSNPADITNGTALSSTQLNAKASVPGTFVYSPAAGTVLPVGTHKLNVTFTPSDAANYTTASKEVTINIPPPIPTPVTPVIIWSNPADITFGTTLSSTQLNAVAKDATSGATVSGQFVYTPAAGTILGAGTQKLHVEFKPTDTASYNSATADASINVTKVISIITWNNPADITNGTTLSSTQLDAKASVPGTFVYNPPAGTVLLVGTHKLNVTFTPTDAANYTIASKEVTINIPPPGPTPVSPVITWSNPVDIIYGTPLGTTQLNAVAKDATGTTVSGQYVYTPEAGAILGAGTQTLHVEFKPTDTAKYITVSKDVTINVKKVILSITWSDPAKITNGTALSSTQLNAKASVPGTFVYTPAAGTILPVGTHKLNVTFTPADAANYTTASKEVNITVIEVLPNTVKAAFDATPTSGDAPLTVKFTDKSTNAASIKWDFGDKIGTSTISNPSYTYKAAGTYTVTLTAYNGEKLDIARKLITVNSAILKINAIKADVTSGYKPLTVRFSSDVSGKPISYIWIINKQTITGSSNGKLTYTFTKAGKYDVTLVVKDAYKRTHTVSKTGFITVLPRVKSPVAAFSATPTSGKAPLTVRFTDKSQNKPDTWQWNFGDGSISYKQNPTHYYKYPGKYTVTLTVKNKGGSNSKTIKNYIVVSRK